MVEYNPVTGALVSTTGIVADPSMQLTLATTFDPSTGTLYNNAISASAGSNLTDYYLVSYNVNTGAVKTLGPLPPAPGSAGPSGLREDAAISSLIVQTPSNGTQVSAGTELPAAAAPQCFSRSSDARVVPACTNSERHSCSNGFARMQILEMRSSNNDPFNWMSWLNPATGASQTMPLPDDW